MLQYFRTFVEDRLDLDEAVALYQFGVSLSRTYEDFDLEVPEWVTSRVRGLKDEIHNKRRDSLEKMLKSAEARLESLKPADEKRADLKKEINRLKGSLKQTA